MTIVGFPMRYMADVIDPIKDPLPKKEPDIILTSPRPRVLLSILRWLHEYFNFSSLLENPTSLRLEDRPLINAIALDYTSISTPPIRL
ncbi:hypothetical protein N7475_005071 [Penicillium sp. IBT 31633x]|nr:hypothetical protein N7475_005071 [Penicillium sp. IBT 31633x]